MIMLAKVTKIHFKSESKIKVVCKYHLYYIIYMETKTRIFLISDTVVDFGNSTANSTIMD